MRLPSIRQLSFFVALIENKSFSKAAEAVHVTQPALSTSIKELETTLGNALVLRDAKSILPTEIGEEVYHRAKTIITACMDLVEYGSMGKATLSSKFSIGVIPTIAPFLLPRIFGPLKGQYPDLELSVKESQTDTLLSDLGNRKLDAAIVALPWDIGDLIAEPILDEALFALIPHGHALSKKERIKAADLWDVDLLMLENGHCLRDHALSACKLSASPPMGLSASSLATLSHMVAAGFGITLLPQMAMPMAETFAPDAVTKPFTPSSVGRKIVLLYRKDSPKAEDCQALTVFLKEALG